jgi:hypothetical protein
VGIVIINQEEIIVNLFNIGNRDYDKDYGISSSTRLRDDFNVTRSNPYTRQESSNILLHRS